MKHSHGVYSEVFTRNSKFGLLHCEAVEEIPTIVCLCGSTRFYKEFQRAQYEETMAGKIVLTVGFYMHSSEAAHGETFGCTPEQKIALDDLHKRKIDLADEVLILNVGGYIGDSTRSELAYALKTKKVVRWLEPVCLSWPVGLGCAPADGKAVHRHSDDKWWFWDETWSDEIGPYDSQELADAAAVEYMKQL